MLIVLAKAKVGQGALDQAREAIAAMVDASNAEEGCIEYTFTADVLDPSSMHIVEKWKDADALAAHFAAPHMAAFGEAIAGLDVEIIEAVRYETEEGVKIM